MYKGIGLYDHFIMGQDSDYNPIKYEDCEGRIANVASIKPRKTKFTPRSYYNCEYCGKWYRSKTSLGLHRRLECGKEPTFQCPYCPLKTHQKGNLQVHVKKKHMDQVLNESFNPNVSRTSDTLFNESSSDFDETVMSQSEKKPNHGLQTVLMDSTTLLQSLGQKQTSSQAGQFKTKPVLIVPKSFSVHNVDSQTGKMLNEISPSFPSTKAPEIINQQLNISFTENYSKIISEPGQARTNQKPIKICDENSKMSETAKKIEAINSCGNIRVEPIIQPQSKLKSTHTSVPNVTQSNLGVEKSIFIHKMGLLSVDSSTQPQPAIVKAVTVTPSIDKPSLKSNISTKNSLISELLASPQLTEKTVSTVVDNSNKNLVKGNNISDNGPESENLLDQKNSNCKIGVKDLKLLTSIEPITTTTLNEEKTENIQTTE